MEKLIIENRRVRAWIMIKANQPAEAARRVYGSQGLAGGDSYVLVRADVVDYALYNVVIPVDAESEQVLQSVYQRILALSGATESAIIRVVEPVPTIPHDAEGFITDDEYERGTDKEHCKPRRQHWSPGLNAWG